MAVAVWPASLPQNFNIEGYRRGVSDGRLSRQMDAGPGRVRMRARAPKPVSGAMMMTQSQFDTLEAWIASDLGGGVYPFTFPAQPGPGTWLVRFKPDAELPQQEGSEYDAWQVSIVLEIMP